MVDNFGVNISFQIFYSLDSKRLHKLAVGEK